MCNCDFCKGIARNNVQLFGTVCVIFDTLVHNMGLELLVEYSLQDIKQFLYLQTIVIFYIKKGR